MDPRLVVYEPAREALRAATDLASGTVAARLEGPVLPFAQVPAAEVGRAVPLGHDRWLLPPVGAAGLKHACDPNCRIDGERRVVTTRPVARGEELTFRADGLTMEEFLSEQPPVWDARRTFVCTCGAPNCRGVIDRYVVSCVDDPNSVRLRLGAVPGKGRAVFARTRIEAGEVIERVPVLVVPEKEWDAFQETSLYRFPFSWGAQGEHAAVALGYGSLYNHSYAPNARYVKHLADLAIDFVALRAIEPGEEVTVNYNGDPNCQDPLGFALAEGP